MSSFKYIHHILIFLILSTAQIYAISTTFGDYDGDVIDQNIKDLERIYRFVDTNFLYEIDHKKVYEAMASAMLDALDDKWTTYIKSSESVQYEEALSGKYSGVGITLSKGPVQNQKSDDETTIYVNVGTVFKGGPAERAGLMTGDLIIEISGQSVREKTASECSNMLRGERGTTVTVKAKRGVAVFELDIVREEINTPTVESEMLSGGIFYIRINSFTHDTSRQVRNAFEQINYVNGIILDLRNNGGGDVATCLEIANLFLDAGNILISTNNKIKSRNKNYYSSRGTIVSPEASIVVLVNNGTASAAEILSLALRENQRAVLVGEKTYGKGVMQYTTQYKDGIVNVTTAEYVSGTGKKVNKIGIEPDIKIEDEDISDDIVQLVVEAQKSGIVHEYVRANSNFTLELLEKGIDQIKEKYDVPRKYLAALLLNEYRQVSKVANDIVAFPLYDKALDVAIKLIERALSDKVDVVEYINKDIAEAI